MDITLNKRPFTRRIMEVKDRRGYRYADLEARCNRARSTAWFNNVVNGRPVSPPTDSTLADLAALLETTERHVAEMVAEEWYGVMVTDHSPRVRALAPRLDALSKDDAALVEQLIQRLLPAEAEDAPVRLTS